MHTSTLAWPQIQKRVRTILMIVVIAGASGSLGAQWFKYPSPRAPRTATGEVDLTAAPPRLANGRPDLSGVWMTAEPLCVIRGTAPISELLKLNPPSRTVPAPHGQLLASEHQPRHRHARRAALPAMARQTRRRAHGEPGDRRSAHQMPARLLSACLRAPSLSEVRPDAGSAGDAERVQRHLPSSLHGRPAAAGGSRIRRGRAIRRPRGTTTRW